MRCGKAALSLGVFLAIAASRPVSAREAVSAPNGFMVELTARMQPGAAPVRSAVRVGPVGRIQRIVVDQNGRRYFAYDLVLDAKEDSQSLQVRLEPSSLSPAQLGEMRMVVDPSWLLVPLVKYPLVPEVRAGDTVAIDLLENPETGRKVVDYLVFSRSKPAAAATAPAAPPARDMSIGDVWLRLKDLRISVNGTVMDASTRVGGEIAGNTLWIYLPERGRFVISLVANSRLGFRRTGEVGGKSLTFTQGQDRYELTSADSIVPAGGRFNLYVRHEPGWRPSREDSAMPFILGAGGHVEWVVK